MVLYRMAFHVHTILFFETKVCPVVGNANALPYILPRAVQRTFKEIKQRLEEEVKKGKLVS